MFGTGGLFVRQPDSSNHYAMTKDVSGPPCPVHRCYTCRVGCVVSNDKRPSTLELKTSEWIQPLSATDRWACEKWCINTPVGENDGMLIGVSVKPPSEWMATSYCLLVQWSNMNVDNLVLHVAAYQTSMFFLGTNRNAGEECLDWIIVFYFSLLKS